MNRILRRGSRLACLVCAALALAGPPGARAADDEPEVVASLDREETSLDGTATLSISVSVNSKGDPGELQLPALRDFDVVSRSSSEQVSFVFNGSAPSYRRTRVTSLTLTPHRAGLLTIEPARLAQGGKTYSTRQLSLRVLPAGAPPQGRGRPSDDPVDPSQPFAGQGPASDADSFAGARLGSRDLVLLAAVDNARPFVGQQVTYSLWLLARVNVSGIDKLQLPRMDGFWTEEIEAPQQLVGEARIVDGVPAQAYLLRRRALFPLRAGKTAVDPAEVEVLTGMGLLFSRASVRRASQPLPLDVQPLPAPRPSGFDPGNVGQWTLTASLEPAAVPAGQPATLRLVLSGRGNLRDVQLPRLPAIPGLRAYDATTADKPGVEQGRAGGTRTVEQLLVPERTGEIELPALTLQTFDPVQKQYRTLRTEPLRLTVGAPVPGPNGPQDAAAPPGAQNLLAAGGLRPIRLRISQVGTGAPPWTSAWFWPALLAGPLLVGGLLGARRALLLAARDPGKVRVRGARSAARKRLRGAEELLSRVGGGGVEFHAEVARALTGYLADKQGVAAGGLTRVELAQALLKRGHLKGVVDTLVALLDECDRARFAPGAKDPKAQQLLLEKADALLAALDRGGREEAA
ncbi:MAG: BatD family protein [Myxococcales bacterium]